MKTCNRCNETKPLESFPRHKQMKDGHLNQCKACKSAANKARWPAIRERQNAKRMERYEANREQELEARRKNYQENKERYNRQSAEWYQEHKEFVNALSKEWELANPERTAFLKQRRAAKTRGIEFLLTFEEWVDWWGDDFDKRGRSGEALQMCRYGDTGPYALWNIYKATALENNTGPRERVTA